MAMNKKTRAMKTTAKTAKSAKSRPTTAKQIRSLAKRKTSSELAKVKQQFEIDAAAQDEFNRLTIKRLAKIRGENVELIKQYRDHVYNLLQETYAVYCDIQNSDYKEDFYNNLRSALANKGISVRSDTTDAALVIRTVFPQFKPKQVYDYGCALMMGEIDNVAKDNLASYVKQKTITKLIKNYKHVQADNDDGRARKLRACTVILRLIENKESHTLATFSERMPAHYVESMFQFGSYTLLMLGTGTRRTDRESFYADVQVNMLLPPVYDVFKFIVNKLASHIVRNVDEWEHKMDELDAAVWCEELREHLFSAELEAERKQAEVRRAYAEMAKIT
jgi:hypothetical protein